MQSGAHLDTLGKELLTVLCDLSFLLAHLLQDLISVVNATCVQLETKKREKSNRERIAAGVLVYG